MGLMGLFKRSVDLHKIFAEEVKELEELGYYSFQIREMIDEIVNLKKAKSLTSEEESRIRQTLLQHINFAKKALTKTGKETQLG